MTAYTTNYAIPYPTGTDTPCSLDDTLIAAAEAIGAALETIEVVVGYVSAPPAVRVSRSSAVTVLSGAQVPFTSVDFDREGVADLTKDDLSIPLSAVSGIYLRGAEYACVGTGTPGTEFTVSLTPIDFSTGTSDQSARDSGTLAAHRTALLEYPGTTTPMTEVISLSLGASSSVSSAAMWSIRMSGTV